MNQLIIKGKHRLTDVSIEERRDIAEDASWSKNTIVLNSNIQSNVIPLDVDVVSANNKNTLISVELIVPEKNEKEYRCTPQFAMIENKWYVLSFEPDRGSYSYESTTLMNELFYKEQINLLPASC